jgi:hypothetical protein
MIRRVLFLTRSDKISISRFLLVSKWLADEGCVSVFMELDKNTDKYIGDVKNYIKDEVAVNKISYYDMKSLFENKEEVIGLLEKEPVDDFYFSPMKHLFTLFFKIKYYFSLLHIKKTIINKLLNKYRETNDYKYLKKILMLINFNSDHVIDKLVNSEVTRHIKFTKKTDRFFYEHDYSAVIYDLEMNDLVRFFISSARKKNIPVYSMQHGVGNCAAYEGLPVLADYYFAYSEYNVKVLLNMGVQNKNIFLTGAPENEILPTRKTVSDYRKINRIAKKIKDDNIFILVALRPEEGKAFQYYKDCNYRLVKIFCEMFKGCSNVVITLRPHPRDHGKSRIAEYESMLQESNITYVCSDMSRQIETELSASDVFISFMSASIVSAIELGVCSYVINVNDGGTWPDWHNSNAFTLIEYENMESSFKDIEKRKPFLKSDGFEENREAFLEHYGTNKDELSASSIAKIICNQVTQCC